MSTGKATQRCVKDCLCLCHEGIGDVEHLGRPCYGKPGSTDVGDFDASRCKCDGFKGQHGTDRAGRPICFHSPVCGCTEYREKDQ